ncbi:MAG: hypothetical protein AAF092_11840 [Pseudomonadota bacterium]
MQTIHNSAKGLGLLVNIAWDRLFFVGAIAAALVASSQLGNIAILAAY